MLAAAAPEGNRSGCLAAVRCLLDMVLHPLEDRLELVVRHEGLLDRMVLPNVWIESSRVSKRQAVDQEAGNATVISGLLHVPVSRPAFTIGPRAALAEYHVHLVVAKRDDVDGWPPVRVSYMGLRSEGLRFI